MNGQKKNYSFYENQITDYLKKNNPYVVEPINMDLRAYERYIKENHLKEKDITQEIVDMFSNNK